MPRPILLGATVSSCLFLAAYAQAECLKAYEAGPFASHVPTYPRALAKVSGTQHAEIALHNAQHVYSKHLSLPEVVLQRSASNWGDTERLRSLFHKLREGKPITMVALGGSITCGADTFYLEQQWSYQVFMWVNATFPHANHTYLNRCRAGTPSMVVGACLDSYVPNKVDLLIIEYTVNDNVPAEQGGLSNLPVMENEWRRGFERFLRKLLKHPSKPALHYLHVYQPAYMGHSFWLSAEMELETILQYYSIPTVSARNALYHLHDQKVHGFAEEEVHCGVHPNPLGHRYYADLVIASLQDHAFEAFTVPEEHFENQRVSAGLAHIPRPMLEENWDFDSECLTGELLRHAVLPELSQGWAFVDEGKPGRPKLGYRTLLPDTSIVLQTDTRSSHKNFQGDVLMAVGYLVSYENMGRFSVACLSGCTCDGMHNISATHSERTSIFKFAYFSASQHEQCRLRITSVHDNSSNGDKVKIDTLMVATGISAIFARDMNAVPGWAEHLN